MKVKELLTGPEKWTQGHLMVDASGTIYGPPVRWCLLGAVHHCYGKQASPIAIQINERLGWGMVKWNDQPERTFEDVRQLVNEMDI